MKKNTLVITFILLLIISINSYALNELNNTDYNTPTEETQNNNNNETTTSEEEVTTEEEKTTTEEEETTTEEEKTTTEEEKNNNTDIQTQNIQEQPEQTNNSEPTENTQPTENIYTYKQTTTSDYESNKIKSSNANLRYLNVDVEGLSPEFDKYVTNYYLVVDLTIENINVEALAEDQNATVTIKGNSDIQEGENLIEVMVVAEDGNTKKYTIEVTKTDNLELINASLKNISVNGFSFYPEFKPNIYNYNLLINKNINKLDILVETEIEEATYEIIGNENLKEGDNLIKIIVTAQNGETKREYKLNAYISLTTASLHQTNKTQAYILVAILVLAIIATGAVVIKQKK